ncbi:hypothetical protein HQ590_01170 [bacterium]|nr:hypothetical protein [bacterium]
MSMRFPFAKVGALSVALAALIAVPAHAAKTKAAQLGPVWTTGSSTSGSSDLGYALNLVVTSPGTVTAKAKIKGKGWKAEFPMLSAPVVAGVMVVNSDTISVPSAFTGQAKLKVKVYHNGKKCGKAKIYITITAPVVVPPVPQTVWYDVGFDADVEVNADAVSTAGLTPPLSYAWKITDTDIRTNATLAGATTATPTLTTLPLTDFPIDLGLENHLVGLDTHQINLSTYHLRVIVSDASQARTGTVTAVSSTVSPAQESIPLGERQYFTTPADEGYDWALIGAPAGSMAALENPSSRFPSLRPDKEGTYTLLEEESGNTVAVKGATYVGLSTCASCHGLNPTVGLEDLLTPWSQTGHASIAQQGLDGIASDHYGESCLACHTVGYEKATLADNGGFDDVQRMTGWTFPNVLQYGNYAVMPAVLQNKANIQCENCHGPGSQHPGEASANLNVQVCSTCHEDGNHHLRPGEWEHSPHAEPYLEVSEEEEGRADCAKCHSPAGVVDYLKGVEPIRATAGLLACQTCHDPHHNQAEGSHQLRVFDTVTVDSLDLSTGQPLVLTGQGASAMCMFCHNARRGAYEPYRGGSYYYLNSLSHESTATDLLLGLNACTNILVVTDGVTNSLASVTLENSAHSGVAKCVDCHMYQGSGHTVGDHTFSVKDVISGAENLASCAGCHDGVDPVTEFDHLSVVSSYLPHGGDYDGDGATEGVQSEVEGVMEHLVAKMLSTGLTLSSNYPFWGGFSSNPTTKAYQRAATWNQWLIARDLSDGIHNTAMTVRLLQWTYTVLSTYTGGNSYAADFPNADLR